MRELSAVLNVRASARFEQGVSRPSGLAGRDISVPPITRALERYTSSESSAGNFAASLLTNGGAPSGYYN
jgi:hypothetical protein